MRTQFICSRICVLIYGLLGITSVHSLICFSNYCAFGPDGKGIICTVEGDGVTEECGHPRENYKMFCYEQPIDPKSGQIKSRGCASIHQPSSLKYPGCSKEHGKRVFGYESYGCLCAEDFCNNRFNNTLRSAFRVQNGYPVQTSDGKYVHLITSESEENFNLHLK